MGKPIKTTKVYSVKLNNYDGALELLNEIEAMEKSFKLIKAKLRKLLTAS